MTTDKEEGKDRYTCISKGTNHSIFMDSNLAYFKLPTGVDCSFLLGKL